MTSVEQLKTSVNCLTQDGDTFNLFHTRQITIIMDPADSKRGCTLIRACTLNKLNMLSCHQPLSPTSKHIQNTGQQCSMKNKDIRPWRELVYEKNPAINIIECNRTEMSARRLHQSFFSLYHMTFCSTMLRVRYITSDSNETIVSSNLHMFHWSKSSSPCRCKMSLDVLIHSGICTQLHRCSWQYLQMLFL